MAITPSTGDPNATSAEGLIRHGISAAQTDGPKVQSRARLPARMIE